MLEIPQKVAEILIGETNLRISQLTANQYTNKFKRKYLKMKARTSPHTKSEVESSNVLSKFWFNDEKRWCMKWPKPHWIFLHDVRKAKLIRKHGIVEVVH